MRGVTRQLSPQARRLENMLARGTLGALNRARKMQRIQAKLLGGEQKQSLEWFENYGFTSAPFSDAELLAAFIDGDRSHGIVISVADRRYRIALEEGEVAIYDDLEHKVHLTRDGIVIDGKADDVKVITTGKMRVEATSLECTGDIKDKCDSTGTTMAYMRQKYNAHSNHVGGTTPNTPM